jgi:uncharacterized protein
MWRPRLIVLQPSPYCNIDCSYCYLQNRDDKRRMAPAVLEAVRNKIFDKIEFDPELTVVWHAGEPTAIPLSWYEQAYAILAPLPTGNFSMQSNGVAIDRRWIEFFLKTQTRVGLSIDGPQRFHDARRRTRSNQPTWSLAVRALGRMQDVGIDVNVITVLHPDGLAFPKEYYRFYRDHDISSVSFSIDEAEGANPTSSFRNIDKDRVSEFLCELLKLAYADGYLIHVREIERIAHILAGHAVRSNEQVEPWQIVVVAHDGAVTTFSPEFMELSSIPHNNFCFGNILHDDFDVMARTPHFLKTRSEIAEGIEHCRQTCRYFDLCGGGAPVNKMFETGSLASAETLFCRLSIQAAADALVRFLDQAQRAPTRAAPHLRQAHRQ